MMTAAQKKNVERFKKAAAEAKKLRKKNPKLTQAQAVKQAFAILYKTGKVAAVKKTATKKKATKKPARKKAIAKSYHKDTKSHNVRINVVSGTQKQKGVFSDFKVYKNHVIDITKSQSGKKWYAVASNFRNIPAFYTDSITIAKKFIEREIKLNKVK